MSRQKVSYRLAIAERNYMADHNDKDTCNISEAAAKLYACIFEALPISGELSSHSTILPMDHTTWCIDSVYFPNAPPPSMRDSCM